MSRQERRRSNRDGRLGPLSTGQMFPAGVRLHDGHCSRCTRTGLVPLASMVIEPVGLRYDVCAECLADYASGASLVGTRVYVWTSAGPLKEVRV